MRPAPAVSRFERDFADEICLVHIDELTKPCCERRDALVKVRASAQQAGFDSPGPERNRAHRLYTVALAASENTISDGPSVRAGLKVELPAEFIGKP